MATGAWMGAVAAESLAWKQAPGWSTMCVLAAIGVAALGLRRFASVALLCTACAASLAAGSLFWHGVAAQSERAAAVGYGRLTLEVVADSQDGRFGPSALCVIRGGALAGARVRARFGRGTEPPELGQTAVAWAAAKPYARDEFGRRMHQQGTAAGLTVRRVEAARWPSTARGLPTRLRARAERLTARVQGPGGDLLAGVLLGDRRRIAGTRAEQDFTTCGLTHLIAVSGSHLAVAAAIVAAVCASLGAGRRLAFIAIVAVVVGYVVFTGASASAVRSAAMAAIAGSAVLLGRRADPLAALGAAATAMIVLAPSCVFDVGFQLSVAAVAGLVVFARLGDAWLKAALPLPRALSQALSMTLVAQVVTAGIVASCFGVVSLVAPVANVLVGPLVEFGLSVGLLALVVLPLPALATLGLRLAALPLVVATRLAEVLAEVPSASVLTPAWFGPLASVLVPAGCALCWLAWPRPSVRVARSAARATLCVAALLLALGMLPRSPEIVMLDVGQGDAILVRGRSHAVLVDVGPDAAAIRRALARHRVASLDAVVLTHLHDDHTGGLAGLAGVVDIATVFGPLGAGARLVSLVSDAGVDAKTAELRAGQRIDVAPWVLDVVWPRQPVADPAENSASVVVLAHGQNGSVLLTGDAEAEVLDEVTGDGGIADVDVLKVGHHGSDGAVGTVSLAALRPEVAAISVGTGNRFGHPRPSTLRMLGQTGARIRRTDQEGDVKLVPR